MPANPAVNNSPAVHYVFVDYENVHRVDLSVIGSKAVQCTLLLGARQTRLDVEVVEKLMEHADSVQLVRLTASGRNALDFALAYYVGRAAMADPAGRFYIVSKDTGFDPLIDHLNSRNIATERHADYSSLPFLRSPGPPPAKAKDPSSGSLNKVLERLRRNTSNRPKRKSTLVSHLQNYLGKGTTEKTAENIVAELQTAGHLNIGDKGAVTYNL